MSHQTQTKISLDERYKKLSDEVTAVKRRHRARGSFYDPFWDRDFEVERIELKRLRLRRLISLRDFPMENPKWEKTTEAQILLEQLKAQEAHYNCLKQLV
ncbi:uncharacterized protein N7479_007596 [Penicillium vulpinum]|uniref:Uncharacterized protein n=1 Tax=Penicillium vulpinum TaxID=29845 RepID=A0A1V6S9R6_9EURO|nr:uncharacterized protein N7479_007596 [Penicillium vulpinum]KAJ5960446.1 hypothetical protein N7479_007596 [Penicillium vulpinum]OQE10795.1 hypothetical protein PENVUL_c003G01170 [Penicillium vulpinum]